MKKIAAVGLHQVTITLHCAAVASKECSVMKTKWDSAIQSLVLVRLGQELGTASELSQAIANAIDFVIGTIARLVG